MTQASRPQADNQSNGSVDAGPYSGNQWAQLFQSLFTRDDQATRSVLGRYANELEVTNPAGTTIRVDTGAAVVDGHWIENDATVDFTPNVPGIASRTDKVVLVENNTNAVYDGTASAVILDFPTVLVDYGALSSVPKYSCRLAVLRGDAGTGAATALIQTASYWMVELYRFNITNVPGVNTLTDNRAYAKFATQVLDARQGGSATVWATPGTNDYIPTAKMLVQCGSITVPGGGAVNLTYPIAYTQAPIVLLQPDIGSGATNAVLNVASPTNTLAAITAYQGDTGAARGVIAFWMSIGLE